MIYDLRTYKTRPGSMAKQLALYADQGFAPQTKHLGKPLTAKPAAMHCMKTTTG